MSVASEPEARWRDDAQCLVTVENQRWGNCTSALGFATGACGLQSVFLNEIRGVVTLNFNNWRCRNCASLRPMALNHWGVVITGASMFLWRVGVERRTGTTVSTVIWSLVMRVVSGSRSVRTSPRLMYRRPTCEVWTAVSDHQRLWHSHQSSASRLRTVSLALSFVHHFVNKDEPLLIRVGLRLDKIKYLASDW